MFHWLLWHIKKNQVLRMKEGRNAWWSKLDLLIYIRLERKNINVHKSTLTVLRVCTRSNGLQSIYAAALVPAEHLMQLK